MDFDCVKHLCAALFGMSEDQVVSVAAPDIPSVSIGTRGRDEICVYSPISDTDPNHKVYRQGSHAAGLDLFNLNAAPFCGFV